MKLEPLLNVLRPKYSPRIYPEHSKEGPGVIAKKYFMKILAS